MKRLAFAIAALLVVAAAGYYAWAGWFTVGAPEPGAVAEVVGEEETPVVAEQPAVEPEVAAEPTAEPNAEPATAPEAEATPPAEEAAEEAMAAAPGEVPALPLISLGGGMGSGMGGGGGDGSGPAGDMTLPPDFWNPWSDTEYTLNAPLPAEPAVAAVYEHPGANVLSLDDMRHFAEAFGVEGPVHTDSYPEPAPGEEAYQPRPMYHIFGESKELHLSDTFMSYMDLEANQGPHNELPDEQLLTIAEQFLAERGLLDFDYILHRSWGNTVDVRRVVDGYELIFPEFQVSMNGEGRVASVVYNPLSRLASLGNYPLRSPETAWQQVLRRGIDYEKITAFTYPAPGFEPPQVMESEVMPVEGETLHWGRTYVEGGEATIFPYPLVYLPVTEGADPIIWVDQYKLSAPSAELQAIAEYVGKPIKVKGIVRGTEMPLTLELISWEPADEIDNQFMPGLMGTISRDGEQVLFAGDGGETFVLQDAPADLPENETLYLYGWRSGETTADGTAIFNWQNIDRAVEIEEMPPMEPEDIEPPTPYKVGEVNIDSVDLVYAFTPVWEATNVQIFLQPAWRFRGITDTNEYIEIFVQAAEDAYIQVPDTPAGPEG